MIGKSARGRDLHLVTVTNFERSDAGKRAVWLQARQHAWEAGTSYVMEGALEFITSGDPAAEDLRNRVVFLFTPMVDPDGCALGTVRFNANGYDLNRHWDEVDLRSKHQLLHMPEIWYMKKAIVGRAGAAPAIDLFVNLHNTETNEYLETQATDGPARRRVQRFFDQLVAHSSFDPPDGPRFRGPPDHSANALYHERGIPVVLMEQRIGTSKKLGRRLTAADRLAFGKDLIQALAQSVLPRDP